MPSASFSPLLKFLVGTAAVVIITFGLRQAAGPVSTVLLAALLAQTLLPLRDWLRSKSLSPAMAVAATILLVIVGGLLISSLLAASLSQLTGNMPVYRASLEGLKASVEGWMEARHIPRPDLAHLEIFDPGKIAGLVGGLATSMLSVLGNTAAIMLLMVFMLVDAGPSPAEPATAAGPFARLAQVAGQTRQYIKITSLTGLIFSVLVTIVMLLVGTDGAVTWGVLGFFLNFVPNLGMLLTVIPPVLLTLLERGWVPAGIVLGAFILINFMTDNVIKPRFMRTGLNLGLLESVLALMFFSWVLGAAGAVLSIPIYLTVREAYRRYAAAEAARPPA